MTHESTSNEGKELNQELFPLVEDEEYPSEEPNHPGWLSLDEILKNPHRVFEKSMFLIGYHHCSNVYVLAGDYLTLIDPGNDYTIFSELDKLGYGPLDIKKIVLTHGHRDHCMGVFELLRYPAVMENKGVEIIMHAAGPEEFKRLVTEAGFPPTELKGGETLDLSGFQWEVLHTPGHTIDSICLYHEPTKTLISGDTVVPEAISDVDEKAGGRWDHFLYGLKLLMKKDVDHLLPGHRVPLAKDGNRAVEVAYEMVLMKILAVTPEDHISWMEGARRLGEQGLLEEVVFCCDKELALRPENKDALQLKALALNDMGRCAEAIEILDEILRRHPDDVYALTGKGHALLGLQQFADSLPCFDAALARDPDLKEAQVFKGMALTFMGRHDEAMQIEAFKAEFMARFKDQIEQRQQELKQSPAGAVNQ